MTKTFKAENQHSTVLKDNPTSLKAFQAENQYSTVLKDNPASLKAFQAENWLQWVKGVYLFRCNLPPALLAECPGSFSCYSSDSGVEKIPNVDKSTGS